MPLTDKGFERRTYDEILSAKIEKARELFGDDIDTSELTPLGKFIRINAYDQALTEEEAEDIYYSMFPTTSTGQSLDRLCWQVGISRNAATAAEYAVRVEGEVGTVVPVGFLVATESEMTFYSTSEQVIGEDGTAVISVSCTQTGQIGNIYPSDINKIVNPVADIKSVIGIERTEDGVESDFALRKRHEQARDGLGSCNVTAIKSALMRVPTVESVGILENDTDEIDSEGRPPRSFECYIAGGDDYGLQIAETIFEKKPIGILTVGDITVTVTDDGGFEHDISFSHTEDVKIYVRISIETNVEFEGDNAKQEIKENIREHINSLGIGNPAIFSALFGHIHAVKGVTDVTEIKLSENETTWLSKNIYVSAYQNCVFGGLRIKMNDNDEYEVIQ